MQQKKSKKEERNVNGLPPDTNALNYSSKLTHIYNY